MENHTDHPLTLTVKQAAKLLGIGRSTAYELVHTGAIPSLRLGRRIVVPVCQVEAMLGGSADWRAVADAGIDMPGPAAAEQPGTSGRQRLPRNAEPPTLF